MAVHRRVSPSIISPWYPFIHLPVGGERQWSKISCQNKQLKTLYTPGLKPLTFRFECQQANAPPPHILSRGAVVKRLVCGTFALNITGEKFGLYPPVIFLDKKLDYSFKSEREYHSECSNFSFIPQLMYLIEYL